MRLPADKQREHNMAQSLLNSALIIPWLPADLFQQQPFFLTVRNTIRLDSTGRVLKCLPSGFKACTLIQGWFFRVYLGFVLVGLLQFMALLKGFSFKLETQTRMRTETDFPPKAVFLVFIPIN